VPSTTAGPDCAPGAWLEQPARLEPSKATMTRLAGLRCTEQQ
jgi:hypothetical protein